MSNHNLDMISDILEESIGLEVSYSVTENTFIENTATFFIDNNYDYTLVPLDVPSCDILFWSKQIGVDYISRKIKQVKKEKMK